MKQMKKLFSLVLAMMMLVSMLTVVSYAEDTTLSNLPTNLTWSSTKNGYFEFVIPEHMTEYFTLRINLYKDDVLFDTVRTSVHPSTLDSDRIFSHSFLTEEILEGGTGSYTYTVTVGSETSEHSTPFEFVEPEHILDVPTNVILVEGQVRWTPVADEYCGGYYVYYYVGYPDGTIDQVYGQEERGATSDYQDYSRDNDVPYYFNQQVDIYYNRDPQKYPKEAAFLMAAVKSNSNDIFMAKDSEISEPVAMTEDTETEFHFNLPNQTITAGSTMEVFDICEYTPERMQFGLVYASTEYEEYINTPATVTFTVNGTERTETLDSIPLVCYGYMNYALELPIPRNLTAGTYQAEICLAIAEAKDANDVKPYVITIPQLIVEPVYEADFTINNGDDMATDKNLTLTFDVGGYTKYKIGDGAYTNLPANNTATYAVSPESGEKELTITFANEDETKTATVTKTILLSNRHTITYYAGGEVFDSVVLDCGSQVPALENIPTAEGKTFAGWDAEIPAVMPDSDLTFNALFLNEVQLDTSALLTEEEIAQGFDVAATTTVAVANTQITDTLETQYSQYEVAMTLDITLQKVKEGDTPTAITEPGVLIAFEIEIPASLTGKGNYLILRDHNGQVDAITETPNDDGEYLTVSGNVITLYAKKFSLYTLATREATPPVSSGGGVVSYSVNFNSNGGTKVKAVNVRAGNTVVKPEDPTKEGYTFEGWYLDKEFTQAYDFKTPVKKSISLYAKWVENAPKTVMVLTIGEKDAAINNETVSNDVAPVIANDRTMLPIRFVAEAFGATVSWNDETKTVDITLADTKITLVVGETVAMVNGEAKELDSASFIENDRTYLPVRFVMESLGMKVEWNEATRQVTIAK